MLSLAVCVRV